MEDESGIENGGPSPHIGWCIESGARVCSRQPACPGKVATPIGRMRLFLATKREITYG